MERMHPLALLANELHLVAKREFSIFYPVLRGWCPEAAIISSRKMKKFYGEQLVGILCVIFVPYIFFLLVPCFS